MQSFEEYRKDFLEDTRSTEESEAIGTVASFVKICALKLFEGDVLPEYTPCYYHGLGYRNAVVTVDGYSYDEHDGSFYLITALYSGSNESENLIGSEAKNSLDRCRAFAANSIEHDLADKIEISTDAYDLASYIQEQAKYVSRFVVILLTDMSLSERANLTSEVSSGKKKKSKRAGVLDAEDICGIDVEYRIWDMPRFYRLFSESEGREEVEINFNDYIEGGIPCLPANTSGSTDCKSYLCTVPGNVIADLYDQYGSRLLEGNVRSYLGKRGVNKDIRNTILNQPERFFVYNNGLAATAVEADVENGKLLRAKDLQIVNGGQTTATLFSARKTSGADLSNVSVLMKLTQVNPDAAAEIVPLISRSANSQTKINPADFFSTHDYHIRLEQISRRKFAPAKDGAQHETHWFYERARGQYIQATMNMTKAEEKKFATQNPKDQVVSKTDLAKVLNSWAGYPHLVSKGAESNFSEFAKRTEAQWETHKDDFNETYFQNAIALVILYRSLDKQIPKQSWYGGGYKANIVAYTTALLRQLIESWYTHQSINLQKIWQKQKCPDVLMNQLLVIAEKVYYAITADDRPVQNVTQWCKQAACWDKIKELKISPVENFQTLLQGYEETETIKREARQLRKIENTIDDQKMVLELGEPYWIQLEAWLRSHPLANSFELSALRSAVKISQGYFPNERQCKSLMELRKKAVGEGFPSKL
ncbi:MAG: AIPR family protein [Ruminococcus sp.]|nr:AIPR family protein [Ruminococcus sp.]